MTHHFLMAGFYNWVCSYMIDFWGVTKQGPYIHWSDESIDELSVLLLQVVGIPRPNIISYSRYWLPFYKLGLPSRKTQPYIVDYVSWPENLYLCKFRSKICLNVSSPSHMESRNVYDRSSMDNFDSLFNLKLKVASVTEMISNLYS